MAKARIVYVVDDKQLKELQAELNKIKKQNKEVAGGFGDSEKEIKKTKGSLVDLKGIIGGLGLAALATGAIVEFAKLTKEINKNRKETALLTKETGAALDNITAKIRATSKVFEKDYNEVLRAANAVSQQLGISMTESMDEINEAMSRGLDINGEYLETISEYSPFMKQAGIDFRQFNVLIQKQVTEGIFSDKGIDAIKEAVISIQEMTPPTKDAIEAIGLSADQITKDIQSGATTYFEVIQEIGVKTREALDPRIKGQVLADIFRGAGEDAGDYALTLDGVGTSFAELTEDQEAFVKSQQALLESSEELNQELIKLTKNIGPLNNVWKTFWNETAAGTLKLIDDLVNGFNNLDKITNSYRDSVSTLTVDEQAEELSDLEKKISNLENSLKPLSKQFEEVFGIKGVELPKKTKDEIEDIQDEIEELTAKTEVLKQLDLERAIATKRAADAEKEAIKKAQEAADAASKRASKAAQEAKEKQDKLDKEAATKSLSKNIAELKRKELEEIQLIEDEFKKTIFEQEIEDEKQLNDELRDINKKRLEQEAEDEKEEREKKIEFAFNLANQLNDIQAQFAQLKIDQINQELTALEFARNRELELAEGNATKEAEINARFDEQKKALQTEQLKKEKEVGLFRIAINTAGAILKAIEIFGPPPSPFGIAAIAAASLIGLTQAGLVLGKKVPEFAEGVLRFQGVGSRKSDSNLVKISDQETILSAQTTDDYYPAIKAIYNREISPDVLNNLVMNQDTSPGTVVYDYNKLAKAVMAQTQKSINVDVNGFTEHIVKTGISIQKKQAKYKM